MLLGSRIEVIFLKYVHTITIQQQFYPTHFKKRVISLIIRNAERIWRVSAVSTSSNTSIRYGAFSLELMELQYTSYLIYGIKAIKLVKTRLNQKWLIQLMNWRLKTYTTLLWDVNYSGSYKFWKSVWRTVTREQTKLPLATSGVLHSSNALTHWAIWRIDWPS